uniref:At1g61320/AtMIF1 LRR domain-containing protein n=1 Tax=Setaria viridis TaxID=4556 RepID=A0A4V6D4X5_SETVI|nr:uncharacterized protein LOC117861101 isoform X2 [Setaria viridis]TKW08164.1 hypothetical protein SEVIR_6G011200v2 [Setaria viridis]TKW08166.1 hypothetical protein SEVIR_6G011200v2 [Setaria viridis]TKW08167.1 hypothetical protein SEVIR_6G011200v2 [Setaria viridis]TKW08170.1 hypothetical protein SEVIR_6G011200v2 [Setaria viridis]
MTISLLFPSLMHVHPETLILEVIQERMEHKSILGHSSDLRQIAEHQHRSLKSVKITGFSSAKKGPCASTLQLLWGCRIHASNASCQCLDQAMTQLQCSSHATFLKTLLCSYVDVLLIASEHSRSIQLCFEFGMFHGVLQQSHGGMVVLRSNCDVPSSTVAPPRPPVRPSRAAPGQPGHEEAPDAHVQATRVRGAGGGHPGCALLQEDGAGRRG